MPIEVEELLERGTNPADTPRNNNVQAIEKFLKKNSKKAWTQKEIQTKCKIQYPSAVNQVLRKFVKDEKVVRRTVDDLIRYVWSENLDLEDQEPEE